MLITQTSRLNIKISWDILFKEFYLSMTVHAFTEKKNKSKIDVLVAACPTASASFSLYYSILSAITIWNSFMSDTLCIYSTVPFNIVSVRQVFV